jgi:hypothetical protein
MAKNRSGPQNEPGNPDGCVIGKKEAKTLTASVEVLSDAFLSGAQTIRASLTLLSDTIFDMALKIERVSNRFNRVLKKTSSTKKAKAEEAGSSSVLLPSRKEVEQLVGSIQIEQPKIIEANAFKLIRPAMTKLIDATESIGKVIGGGGGIETPNYRLLDASSKKVVKTNPRVEVQTNRKLLTLASMGTRPGSMYTHDIHCEKVLLQIAALLTQAEKTSKPKGSKPKSKGKKEKTDLDLQIDELRSKFPRLTKLFIDGPAKLKEEFKYWSGVMATGWGFASKTIKSGAKYTYKALKPKENIPQVLSEFGDGIAMANRILEDYWYLKVTDEEKKPQKFKEKKQKFSVDALDESLTKLEKLKTSLKPSTDAIEDAAASFLSITDTFANAFDNEKKTKTKNQNQNKGKMIESDPYEGAYNLVGEPRAESFKYSEPKSPINEAIPLTIFSDLEKAINEVNAMLGSAAETVKTVTPEFKGLRAMTREASIMLNKLAESGKKVESNPRKERFDKQSKRKRLQYRASGGPATPSKDDAKGTDTVPAMLTPGEFVVNKDATKKNRGVLEQINNGGKTQKRSSGGPINYLAAGGMSSGGGGGGGGSVSPQMSAFMTGITFAGKSLGVLGSVTTMAVGSITGTIGLFSQLIGFAGPFVQAFNPALVEQMNLAFKDLTAIIGMALEPVIGATVTIIRAFADKLVPVVQALIPTVQLFADSMIELAGPIITILIEAFAALEPIILLVANTVQIWAEVLTWSMPLIAAVIKEVVWWFSKIVTTIQWVIGRIMSMIPGTGDAGKKIMDSANRASQVTEEYYKGTSKVQKAVGKPVVKGASVGASAGKAGFSGISDLSRNLMQSSMSSSTQASQVQTAKNTENMDKTLTRMDERMSRVPLPDPAAPRRGGRV